MFAFERVLAPIDLRGDFELRAQYALDIAAALEAELTLLHVVNSRRLGKRNSGLSWPECAMTRTNPPCVVHRAVVHGEVPAAVARYAAFVDASLIVLGVGRRASWTNLWRRSMIEKIAAATGKPVLSGNAAWGQSVRLKPSPRILCMLGLTGEDRALAEYAQSLVEHSGGDLILYAAAPSGTGGTSPGKPAETSPSPATDAAADRLNSLGASLRVPNWSVVGARASHSGLRGVIRRNDVDLVVALRSHHEGIPGVGFGFGELPRNLSCPLLSITTHTLAATAVAKGDAEALVLAR